MEIKKRLQLILLLLILFLTACSAEDCFDIASDQLKFSDSVGYQGKTYYLYTRTTGFQEKVVYFELYDGEPIYDVCTQKTNPEPLFGIHYDYFPNDPDSKAKYVKELKLQLDQPEKLKITYTTDVNEGVKNVYDVKFTHK
jgi:hypothetical protein